MGSEGGEIQKWLDQLSEKQFLALKVIYKSPEMVIGLIRIKELIMSMSQEEKQDLTNMIRYFFESRGWDENKTIADDICMEGHLFEVTAAEAKDAIMALGKEKAEPIVRPFIGSCRFNDWLSEVKLSKSHKPLIDLHTELINEFLKKYE